jgi:hypothetical protein
MICFQSRDEPLGFRELDLRRVQQQALETVAITIDNPRLLPTSSPTASNTCLAARYSRPNSRSHR